LISPKATVNRNQKPHPIDIYAGARLRMQRQLIGMSQQQMAKSIGLTFQQIQKYEGGTNRLSASCLYQIAQVLKVPVSYFFDELTDPNPKPQKIIAEQASYDLAQKNDDQILRRRETLELVRSYYRIDSRKQRHKVYALIRSMNDKPIS